MLTWFDSDCLVIFWRLYFLSALQSDNNNNMFLGMNMFWALILRAHFNSHLAAKMSPSKVPFPAEGLISSECRILIMVRYASVRAGL